MLDDVEVDELDGVLPPLVVDLLVRLFGEFVSIIWILEEPGGVIIGKLE